MYLDVGGGEVRVVRPLKEPDEMPPEESCSIDIAESGALALIDVGALFDLTRERIRQIEAKAIGRLQAFAHRTGSMRGLAEHVADGDCFDDGESPLAAASEGSGGGGAPEYSEERADATLRPLFHEEGREEDDCERVFATYDRAVRERDALARGELANLGGFPLNPSQARAVSIIREWLAERGRGPFVMELADLLGIQGETEASRRAIMTTRMQGLREAGLVMYSRDRGFTIVEPRPPAIVKAGPIEDGPNVLRVPIALRDGPVSVSVGGTPCTNIANVDDATALFGEGSLLVDAVEGFLLRQEVTHAPPASASTGNARADESKGGFDGDLLKTESGDGFAAVLRAEAAIAAERDHEPAVSPSAGATLEASNMSSTRDESSLTDKQRAILAGYRAGESCADIAANVGSPVESVQSTATRLRSLGFDVPRSSTGRRAKTTPEPPPAASAEPRPKLSPKQAKVLVAVKAGKSEKQIAVAMKCSLNAAKAVVTVLRRKGALPRTHVGEAISRAFKEHPKPKRSRSGDAVVDSLQERIESLVAEERALAEKRQKLEAARDALVSE